MTKKKRVVMVQLPSRSWRYITHIVHDPVTGPDICTSIYPSQANPSLSIQKCQQVYPDLNFRYTAT